MNPNPSDNTARATATSSSRVSFITPRDRSSLELHWDDDPSSLRGYNNSSSSSYISNESPYHSNADRMMINPPASPMKGQSLNKSSGIIAQPSDDTIPQSPKVRITNAQQQQLYASEQNIKIGPVPLGVRGVVDNLEEDSENNAHHTTKDKNAASETSSNNKDRLGSPSLRDVLISAIQLPADPTIGNFDHSGIDNEGRDAVKDGSDKVKRLIEEQQNQGDMSAFSPTMKESILGKPPKSTVGGIANNKKSRGTLLNLRPKPSPSRGNENGSGAPLQPFPAKCPEYPALGAPSLLQKHSSTTTTSLQPATPDNAVAPVVANEQPTGCIAPYPPACPSSSSSFSVQQVSDVIPDNASSIFHILDRRVNFDSHPPDTSNYALLRSWVQDDPYRQIPPPDKNLLNHVELPLLRRDPLLDKMYSIETTAILKTTGTPATKCDLIGGILNKTERQDRNRSPRDAKQDSKTNASSKECDLKLLLASHIRRAKHVRKQKKLAKEPKRILAEKRLLKLGVSLSAKG